MSRSYFSSKNINRNEGLFITAALYTTMLNELCPGHISTAMYPCANACSMLLAWNSALLNNEKNIGSGHESGVRTLDRRIVAWRLFRMLDVHGKCLADLARNGQSRLPAIQVLKRYLINIGGREKTTREHICPTNYLRTGPLWMEWLSSSLERYRKPAGQPTRQEVEKALSLLSRYLPGSPQTGSADYGTSFVTLYWALDTMEPNFLTLLFYDKEQIVIATVWRA